jgi:hypothetical protein
MFRRNTSHFGEENPEENPVYPYLEAVERRISTQNLENWDVKLVV